MTRGLVDELNDRHYLIVDGTDGRTHYVDIGRGDNVEPLPAGAIVRIEVKSVGARPADRTVAEVAAANGGRYSVDLHLRHDPLASQDFAETHVRRLEAMRRMRGSVEREANGSWVIAADHVDRAAEFERRRLRERPVSIEILSRLPLEQQVGADGFTWLDRELVADAPDPVRDSGFGRAVRDAQQLRRQWLIGQGLGEESKGRFAGKPGMIETLRRRELARVADQLAGELGLAYRAAQNGERVRGTLRRSINLASGRFAVIGRSKDFTLVPWRPTLEGRLGQQVAGVSRGGSISWSYGRQRAGVAIS